jgi:tryptophan-rich sensory protein
MSDPKARWKRLAFATVPATMIVGDAIGWALRSDYQSAWFVTLAKPFFMPPAWVFGLAWNILYALLGLSLAIVLAEPTSERRRFALVLFFIQLALNYAWSPLFFGAHDIVVAQWLIFFMAVIAAAAAGQFLRIRKSSGLLLVPYLVWLIFAATLNATIVSMNPSAGSSLLG